MLQGTFRYMIHVYNIRVTIQTCSVVFVIVFQTENTFHKNINYNKDKFE